MPLETTQPPTAPLSWLEAYRDGRLREFHRVPAGDLEAALEGTHPADRALLEAAASAYLKRIGAPKKALQNAARLAHPNSRVVIAGQQAGLLSGPAYTVSKAINAILLARQADREDRPVVPVFWVASQDHDVLEVAGTRLLDLNEQEHAITLELPANRPVGRIALERAWVERCLRELRDFAAPEEFKKPVYDLVESSARGSSSYAEWFARIVSGLLGPHGLVVVDPLTPEFAPLFAPFIRHELCHPLSGTEAIEEAAIRLEALGFAPQLRRPAGSTNLFLEGDDHQRRLLRFDGKEFQADRTYSREELEAILEADPSRLTPAAGLRPTLADAILPSAASILGPSELAYQLELAGVYALHNVPQPLLWPRMSVTWLEPPVRRILARYDLGADAFVSDPSGSLERTLLERTGAAESFRAGLVDLELAFERLAGSLDPLDPTLKGALSRSRSRVMGHVARLEKKVAASLVRLEDTADHQFERLNLHLKPHGTPQERSENFLSFLMKYGPYTLERMLRLEPHGSHTLEI
jgi:bacillithiol biosynthesis cysteine-adding enzyme BshC